MLSYGVGWGGGGGGRRMEEKCKSMPKNEALGDKQLNFRYGREMGFPSGTVKKKKKKKILLQHRSYRRCGLDP